MIKVTPSRVRFSVLYFSLFVCGCDFADHYRYHDPSLQLDNDQYKDLLMGQEAPSIPHQAHFVQRPQEQPPEFQRPISIAMAENAPLKDVLTEMARQAKVNLILDPQIQGGLHFQAYGQPFIEVIQHICELGKLRHTLKGKILCIGPDSPYLKTYDAQFLNLSRQKQNRISTTTDVFTSMEGYSREFDNGSSTLVTDSSKSDFWDELEKNLKVILEATSSVEPSQVAVFTLHKQAGLITIFANQKQHRQIEAFLGHLNANTLSQVLIEAKIIEVNLNEEFKSGINWHIARQKFHLSAPLGTLAKPGVFDPQMTIDRQIMTLGGTYHNLTGLVNLLQHFGTVRTLSSPRITVMNNHSAVLKVARNHVFFKINYLREIPEDRQQRILERASSQIQTVPIGLVMVVHPTIDSVKGRITMALRPTISSVACEKEDPAVSILSEQKKISTVPEVQVRELDSVLHVNSGGIVIMGGLMEEKSSNAHNGIPGVDDIPFLGALISGKEDRHEVTELVIFLRATIIDGAPIDPADKRIYETFSHDPRPLGL